MYKIIFHAGFPRCASSTLQKHLSQYYADGFLGKRKLVFRNQPLAQLVRNNLLFTPADIFRQRWPRGCLPEITGQLVAKDFANHLVLSDEILSTVSFSNIGLVCCSFEEILERLAWVCDTAPTIMLVVRRHGDFLRSYHRFLVHLGYPGYFPDFLNYLRTCKTPFDQMLQYTKLEELIQSTGCIPWLFRFEHFIEHGWRELDELLGIPAIHGDLEFEQENASPEVEQLQVLLANNRDNPRNVGLRLVKLIAAGSIPPLKFSGNGSEADAAGREYIAALEKEYWHPLKLSSQPDATR